MSEQDWGRKLSQDGWAFVEAPDMRAALARDGRRWDHRRPESLAQTNPGDGLRDWDEFARTWDDLGLDTYMADGGRYRKRRHAAFRAGPDGIARKPHQAHYQSRDYNALHGGIARWFEPIRDTTAETSSCRSILALCNRLFSGLTPASSWHVEAHQFRIEARPGETGKPTPEGVHQDGVDWVLVLMVNRVNIAEGTTTIHGMDRRVLGSFTLQSALDSALVDDHRVFHGVTPVVALDPARPAYRDVLVVTFRKEG